MHYLFKNIFTGIARKFLLSFFFFSIVPIAVLTYFGYRISEQMIVSRNLHYLELQNELVENRLQDFLKAAHNEISLRNAGNIPVYQWIQKQLLKPFTPRCDASKQVHTYFRERLKNQSYFRAFALLDTTARILCTSDSAFYHIDRSRRYTFLRRKNPIILEHPPAPFPQPAIFFLTPLTADAPSNRGFIIGWVDNKHIQTILHYFSTNRDSSIILLLDGEQHVMYASSEVLPSYHISPEPSPEQQRSGIFTGADGHKIIRHIQPVPELGWYIVSEIPYHIAMSDLMRLRTEAILVVGALLILLIGLAFWVSQRISIPLRQLVYAAQDIGDGFLDTPIKIQTQDEIGQLAREFDEMRRRLLDYYENLERKVEERTRELERAQHQIMHQEKMASLGLMAAGIAHEIGNPLTSISSLTQLLKRRLKDETNLRYLTTIMKNIERISRIVRELVDFSRPSNYEPRPTDVNEVARTAVGIVKYDSRSKQIQFHLELSPELPRVFLVADQLLQVFINILFNAVDAMEHCGSDLLIQTEKQEESIVIQIRDTGCGIPESDLNKIFEPFYTTKEVGKGTGLGLSVSYGIIKNWGGEIRVESQVNRGSTFTIILPLKNLQKPAEV